MKNSKRNHNSNAELYDQHKTKQLTHNLKDQPRQLPASFFMELRQGVKPPPSLGYSQTDRTCRPWLPPTASFRVPNSTYTQSIQWGSSQESKTSTPRDYIKPCHPGRQQSSNSYCWTELPLSNLDDLQLKRDLFPFLNYRSRKLWQSETCEGTKTSLEYKTIGILTHYEKDAHPIKGGVSPLHLRP